MPCLKIAFLQFVHILYCTGSKSNPPPPNPATCFVNVTNNNNVGHIYANVLPAVLSPPLCNTFIAERVINSPLLKIMDQLRIPYKLLPLSQLTETMSSRPGSGFEFSNGFAILKGMIGRYMADVCNCNMDYYNITVFNRKTRHMHNTPKLLRRFDDEGFGPVRYLDSSREDNQCWYFCTYSTSAMVVSVYGAESIYPYLLNTSFVSVAYEGIADSFLYKVQRSYNKIAYGQMRATIVKAQIVEENYNKVCVNLWRNFTVTSSRARQMGEKPSPLIHKCISLYLDSSSIDDIVNYARIMIRDCDADIVAAVRREHLEG